VNTTEREFLSKVWFIIATFVAWNSLTIFYGCFDPGRKLEIPVIGAQSFTERAVLGIPLLFFGYLVCYALAFIVLRRGKTLELKDVPTGEKLTGRFIQWTFWTVMFIPVVTLVLLHFGGLHRIHFCSDGENLTGWSIYKFVGGSWYGHGIDDTDLSHPTVKPGWMPSLYLVFVIMAVASYFFLPLLVRTKSNSSR
jgi:hypothetical protein